MVGLDWFGVVRNSGKSVGLDTSESHWKNKIGNERFGVIRNIGVGRLYVGITLDGSGRFGGSERFGVVRSGRSGSEWSGLWEKALD